MGLFKDMKNGEAISVRLPVVSADVRKTVGQKNYLAITFTDGTDTIEGRWWNYNTANPMPEVNVCYIVSALVSEYQGVKQLNVSNIVKAVDQDLTAFMQTLGIPEAELRAAVAKAILQIEDQGLMKFVAAVYDKYDDILYLAPSAKGVHHVGIGGNIIHSLEVFNIGSDICKSYPNGNISSDLVKAGALLHDIGKAKTYMMTGPIIDYTYDGHLFDHIVLGIEMLESVAAEVALPAFSLKLSLLKHIIASHHGTLEWGSPVTPKFIEAFIVNIADGASATIDTVLSANAKAGEADMTDKVWACGNRPLFTQLYVGGTRDAREE
jgi:3'-5' exoribonuclease